MLGFVQQHIAFDHSRTVLPWFRFARDARPVARLRRTVLALEAGAARPRTLWACLFHPPVSLRQIWIAFSEYRKGTRANYGLSYFRQFRDLLHLTWRLNQPPHDYYRQKLWLHGKRSGWINYLQHREHVTLVNHLKRALPVSQFDDKLNLFLALKAAGVPTIEVLLVAQRGRWHVGFPLRPGDPALRRSVILKPTDEAMSNGIQVWHYISETNSYEGIILKKTATAMEQVRQKPITASAWGEQILSLSAAGTLIVQPLMRNHPDLDPISPRSVANFRIVTAVREQRVAVIVAVLRMGYDVGRFIPSVYLANINLETGELGMATGNETQWGYAACHIETGERVAG